jgi:hypothetical protein
MMSCLWIPVVALGLTSPTESSSRPPDAVAAAPASTAIGVLYVNVEGIDDATLNDAIALRAPDVELRAFETKVTESPDRVTAYAELRLPTTGPRDLRLTIIVADGRAFDRVVPIGDDEDASRVAANALVNLLRGIEAGAETPDREAVPLPVAGEPAADCPTCPPADAARPPQTPVKDPTEATTDPPPRLEISIGLGVPMIVGLGPPNDADRFAAWGGNVSSHARLPRGWIFGGRVRVAGRRVGDAAIVRARFAVTAGWDLRRHGLGLMTEIGPTVEVWGARRAGERATFDPTAVDATRPLLGGMLRVSPGWRSEPRRGRAYGVGGFAELAAASVMSTGVARIVVQDAVTGPRTGRVGGVEVAAGLEASIWFGVGARR